MIASEPCEIKGPPPTPNSGSYIEIPISYDEEIPILAESSYIEIPISYDEESDYEGYNYCRTEGDCRPEMSYPDFESDDANAKSFELNALDIVKQMYRTPSETSDSRTVTEKSEC
jgi:hypothetical protein